MAELEVVKHTKKAFKIFNSDNPVVEKIMEFLLEIVIIVFAVSITIWFHDIAEHRHQQKEVKEFLLGLKNDLASDLTEMESDKHGYHYQQSAFRFFVSMDAKAPGTADSLQKYYNAIFNKVQLVQNNGRFEGFKASGKMGNIENKHLQNEILDLYQELIPSLLGTTELYNAHKDRLITLIEQNGRIDPTSNTVILPELMKKDQAKIISFTLSMFPTQIIERYDVCVTRAQDIIKAIDEEYKD